MGKKKIQRITATGFNMIDDYWYPWQPARFRADTAHLTPEQDGIYRRLIDHYMETKLPLPDNENALARIAGIGIDQWVIASAIVLPFFCHSNGKLYSKKCDENLAEEKARSRKKSEAGKNGAKKRWKKDIDKEEENSTCYSTAIADPMRNDSTGQDRTLQDKERKDSSVGVDREEEPHPADRSRLVFDLPEEWRDWCKNEMCWPEQIIADTWLCFGSHYRNKVGQVAFKTHDEWGAYWRKWCTSENIKIPASLQQSAVSENTNKFLQQTPEEKRRWYRKLGIGHPVHNPQAEKD